jgi:uncharacterized membrane protein YhaH (DUF805 family)
MKYYVDVMKKYAVFNGRARRKEYWMFVLFNLIFLIVAMILDNILGTKISGLPYGLIYCLYAVAIIVPALAVSIRRLHDIGKSGWYIFVNLIPLAGFIWYLVLLCSSGNTGENKYGPDPKAVV